MAVKITEKETKAGKKFRQEIEKLKKLQVRVGYQRGEENIESEGESADLCDIAAYNELEIGRASCRERVSTTV